MDIDVIPHETLVLAPDENGFEILKPLSAKLFHVQPDPGVADLELLHAFYGDLGEYTYDHVHDLDELAGGIVFFGDDPLELASDPGSHELHDTQKQLLFAGKELVDRLLRHAQAASQGLYGESPHPSAHDLFESLAQDRVLSICVRLGQWKRFSFISFPR